MLEQVLVFVSDNLIVDIVSAQSILFAMMVFPCHFAVEKGRPRKSLKSDYAGWLE